MRLNKIRRDIRKKAKGITLVALVVTIIVLIILAGVSISLVLGNNGIISKAREARTDYQLAANLEQLEIDELYGQLQIAADGTVTMDMNTLNGIIQSKINDSVGQTINTLENTIQEMQETVATLQSNQTPVGTIISYSTSTVPSGYLECNGQEVSRETYSALFAKIGTTYGAGDGSTTFKVPDLRGEFLRGTGTATRNTGTGEAVGTHQDATRHVAIVTDGSKNIVIRAGQLFGYSSQDRTFGTTTTAHDQLRYAPSVNDTTTGENSYTSRPTNTAVLYCIKY